MRISARCDYACKALLELSLHWPSKEPLQIQQISEKQGIPQRYLVQILIQLKRLGYVASHRGKQGGYTLAKDPGDIRLGEVIRDITGPLVPIAESVVSERSEFLGIWKRVEEVMAKVLDDVSFKDICSKTAMKEEAIVYQI